MTDDAVVDAFCIEPRLVQRLDCRTSSNSNSVSTLGLTVSDPPTQSEVQVLANKLDELINTLRR